MSEYEIAIDETARLARLSQWLAGSLAFCLAASTLIRPLIVELSPIFTYLGWTNTALTLAAYSVIASRRVDQHAPTLLMLISLVALLPVLSISGGVNSQFAVLIPLFPLCGVLFAGRNTSLAVAAFLILLILFDLAIGFPLHDLTEENFDDDKSRSRSVWLLIATGMGAYFAYQFERSLTRLRKQLWELANLDALTGLANRRAIDDQLAKELARSRRSGAAFSLLMIDVDHFKRVNDFQGHAAGDQCLRTLANALASESREGQDAVARLGGEEFVILLSATSSTGAQQAAQKISDSISSLAIPYGLDTTDTLTVTIGYATLSPDDGETVASLLQRADRALYAGKAAGRNRVVSAEAFEPTQ